MVIYYTEGIGKIFKCCEMPKSIFLSLRNMTAEVKTVCCLLLCLAAGLFLAGLWRRKEVELSTGYPFLGITSRVSSVLRLLSVSDSL